jgi:hypothetical protein
MVGRDAGASIGSVYYSDDAGETWAEYAAEAFENAFTAATRKLQGAYHQGSILLLAQADGTNTVYQLASTDEGALFRELYEHTNFGLYVGVCTLPGAGFGVAWERASDNTPVFARVGAATQDLTDADEVVIDAARTSVHGLAVCCSPDGRVYVVMADGVELVVYESLDLGETWTELPLVWQHPTTSPQVHADNLAAAWTADGLAISHTWDNTLGSTDDIGVFWLGGWSSLQREELYPQWEDLAYLPWDSFSNQGWTTSGAGSEAAVVGGTELTGPFAAEETISHTGLTTRLLLDITLDPGVGSAISNEVYCRITAGSGVQERDYRLRMWDGGWQLLDYSGGAGGTLLAQDLFWDCDERTQFRIAASRILYRRPEDDAWQVKTFSNGAVAGAAASGLCKVELTQVGDVATVHFIGADTSSNFDTTDEADFRGRPCGGVPVWLPELGVAGGKLALVGGPATSGTAWTIEPTYDYGVGEALPPGSPSTMWLSGVETEQIIAWDLGVETLVGPWVGLYVARARFRYAYLEYHDGSAWQTAASLDLGADFDTIDYTRTGDLLTPTSSPASAARYIQAGELAGGWALYGTDAAVIRHNTGGSWVTASTTKPFLHLGEAGADPGGATSGTCTLIPPRGCVIASVGRLTARYWRVRIPAQPAPPGGIGAGLILPGFVHAVGCPPGWAWSDGLDPNVARSRSPAGTPSTTELGPPARTWAWAWTEGQILTHIRSTLDLDYLSPSVAGAPLVAVDDVWWQLDGLMHRTEGGAIPVVALRVMADDDVTVTDRTRMLLCEVETGPSVQGLAGQEGTTEAVRVESVTMREVV